MCFELNQITNINKLPLTFAVPSYWTADSKGTKSIVIKITDNEKTLYTCIHLGVSGKMKQLQLRNRFYVAE